MTSHTEHWALSPYPLQSMPDKPDDVPEAFYKCAIIMAQIHNLFTRGLNSIYKHAPIVAERGTRSDKADFIHFGLAWYEGLHAHHTGEELWYFTELENASDNAGLMKANVEQHDVFHAPLDAFQDYLKGVVSAPEMLDGARVVSLIEAFAPSLIQHLHDEIPTLFELGRRYPDIPIEKIDEEHAKKMLDTVTKTNFLPLFFTCHDRNYDGGKWNGYMPPSPAWLLFMIKWVFSLPNRGAWRFSPSTFDLELKPSMMQF